MRALVLGTHVLSPHAVSVRRVASGSESAPRRRACVRRSVTFVEVKNKKRLQLNQRLTTVFNSLSTVYR